MKDIKRYRIIKKIGEGGTSAVYAARDTRTGKKVTVKALKKESIKAKKKFDINLEPYSMVMLEYQL